MVIFAMWRGDVVERARGLDIVRRRREDIVLDRVGSGGCIMD